MCSRLTQLRLSMGDFGLNLKSDDDKTNKNHRGTQKKAAY